MNKLFAIMFLLSSGTFLYSESITVVNRTGSVLEIIQGAPSGIDQWGNDLIPGLVILDGESVPLDLTGTSPWAFRMLDTDGVVYVLYDVMPAMTGKLTIGPEHQAKLAVFAGPQRDIILTNRTGLTLSSLRISAVSDNGWGPDILSGRYIRDGESAELTIDATAGTLSFDIRFILISADRESQYEKSAVILTDGASLVLTSQPQP
jgi:hypothetical protein